jgi:hypothetical protein
VGASFVVLHYIGDGYEVAFQMDTWDTYDLDSAGLSNIAIAPT